MIVLGLGSNYGDRLEHLRKAVAQLEARGGARLSVRALSPIYESQALLPEGSPAGWNMPFLNMAVLCEGSLAPLELLEFVKDIERVLGRRPRGRWAPREIDIDILAMGDRVFRHAQLNIPHIALLERPFALLPLTDLAPTWVYPGEQPSTRRTAGEYAAAWKFIRPDEVPCATQRSSLFLTELIGVLNITPDSFSDGGLYLQPERALEQAERLVETGASILDLGAESTRPGARVLHPDEEWERLAPALDLIGRSELAGRIKISVDTRHPEVAEKAIRRGVDWINDVTGFESEAMKRVVADAPVDLVMMHSLGIPPSRDRVLPLDQDPVELLIRWAEQRIHELEACGTDRSRIVFDPGLGFGKTSKQSAEILNGVERFRCLGVRVLVGHSRKSFLSQITAAPPSERDLESVTITTDLVRRGVEYLRVHDVALSHRCLKALFLSSGVTWKKGCAPSEIR